MVYIVSDKSKRDSIFMLSVAVEQYLKPCYQIYGITLMFDMFAWPTLLQAKACDIVCINKKNEL